MFREFWAYTEDKSCYFVGISRYKSYKLQKKKRRISSISFTEMSLITLYGRRGKGLSYMSNCQILANNSFSCNEHFATVRISLHLLKCVSMNTEWNLKSFRMKLVLYSRDVTLFLALVLLYNLQVWRHSIIVVASMKYPAHREQTICGFISKIFIFKGWKKNKGRMIF